MTQLNELDPGKRVDSRALAGMSIELVVVGFLMGSWGPLIPQYAKRVGETTASLGILLGVASGAGFLMVIVGGFLVHRWQVRRVLQLGGVFIAVGFVGLAFGPSRVVLIVAAFIAGSGVALSNLANNQALSRSGHHHALRHSAIGNTTYSIGAISAPLLFALGLPAVAGLLGAAAVALLSVFLVNDMTWFIPRDTTVGGAAARRAYLPIVMLLIGIGTYVALEASIAGWLPTAVSQHGGSATLGAWASTIFYIAMTIGRGSFSIAGNRFRPSYVAAFGMGLTLFVLLALGGTPPVVSVTLAGLFMAPIFPATAVWLAKLTPGDPAPTTWMLLAAQAGGTVVPPLMGYLVTGTSIAFAWLLAPIAAFGSIAYVIALLNGRRGQAPTSVGA